jgi:hypothetical protein
MTFQLLQQLAAKHDIPSPPGATKQTRVEIKLAANIYTYVG